jgi:hypothetical protein
VTDTTDPPAVSGEIVIEDEHDRVLDGVVVSNPDGDCIRIKRSTEIVIRNAIIGPCAGSAIHIQDSRQVAVETSELSDTAAGVYALDSSSISVTDNLITDAGRNPIQYDKVTLAGNLVSGNRIINVEGSPRTEDSINIYQSGGTGASPLVVEDNLVFNGGSSLSGSGILVGDNGGSHTIVRRNTLINPGQAGIGVAGGRNIRVIDNVVYSAPFPWSNVGIYVWDQYESQCMEIEVNGNTVQWLNGEGEVNAFFDAGNCGPVVGWDDNAVTSDLEAVLRGQYGELWGDG